MSQSPVRVAVVGAGAFGRNHLRVLKNIPAFELTAVADSDAARASAAAQEFGRAALADIRDVSKHASAAVVATPTSTHAEIACTLLEAGLDVLVEKPIAATLEEAQRIVDTASRHGRILQVGHLERFNPAVAELEKLVRLPLFFEVHRLSLFTPRSLDVDVVLDLMIHDLEIILAMTRRQPEEVRAAGISILSPKVDIANVRLAFAGGCVANLTASRVSTEKVRKIRIFQPNESKQIQFNPLRMHPRHLGHISKCARRLPSGSIGRSILERSAPPSMALFPQHHPRRVQKLVRSGQHRVSRILREPQH